MNKYKNLISVLWLIVIIIVICFKISSFNSNETINKNSTNPKNENFVSQEDIDFILNREVFISGMDSYYKEMFSNYEVYIDPNIKFSDLLNEKYFENINWKYFSTDADMSIVVFSGITKNTYNNIPVSASFSWTSNAKSPIISHFIFGKNDDGTYNEHSINTIKNEYNYDDTMALFTCDATFSFLLSCSLINIQN